MRSEYTAYESASQRAQRFGFNAYKMRVVTPETLIPLVAAFKAELPGLGVKFDDGLLEKYPCVATQNTMVSADETDIRLAGIRGRRNG